MSLEINLLASIDEIKKEIRQQEKIFENKIQKMREEFQLEVQPLKDTLKELRKMNTVCEHCKGEGGFPAPRYGHVYRVKCDVCHGSGKSK